MQLQPCPQCHRHVAIGERRCPFCAAVVPPIRAQHVALVGRVSRAAVFSAALVACSNDKAKPAPAPAADHGSDDLEKLLDTDERAVPHPDPAPSDAAGVAVNDAALATASDAAITADAGADPTVDRTRKERLKRDAERRRLEQQREAERKQLEQLREPERTQIPKPYGAPPARRRVV